MAGSSPLPVALDAPLVSFTPEAHMSTRQVFEGVSIMGETGSGKTSGSGRTIAHALLKRGFGGLVLCAKPDEADTWRRYAAETGREDSFLFVDGRNSERFNFLQYELMAYANEGSQVNNTVEVFTNIMKVVNGSQGSNSADPFWENATRDMLRHAFSALTLAYGDATIHQVHDLLKSAPSSVAQLDNQNSFCIRTLDALSESARTREILPEVEAIADYFAITWGRCDPKLKGNLLATLSSITSAFSIGRLRELLCTNTTFIPEMTHKGNVIVLDLPLKSWGIEGTIAQHVFKYAWQRATERRGNEGLPVFLWADEAQFFISDYDAEFQSTARSARAASVYLTQNINSYRNALKTHNAEHTVNALLANLKTKIFHSNNCMDTNNFAAELIGKQLVQRRTESDGWSESESHGVSESTAHGITRGSSYGENEGVSVGINESHSRGSNRSSTSGISISKGKNKGGTRSFTGDTWSFGSSWGSSKSETTNASSTHGTSSTSSSGRSRNDTRGVNRGSNQGSSRTTTHGTSDTNTQGRNHSSGWNEQKDYILEPYIFRNQLSTHGGVVDGIIVQSGYGMPSYTFARFKQ